MSIAILKEITAVENEAQSILTEAQLKAKETVATARTEASALVDSAVNEAGHEAEDIIRKYEAKADEDIGAIRQKTRNDCDEIIKNSGARLEEAVNFIIGRILKQ